MQSKTYREIYDMSDASLEYIAANPEQFTPGTVQEADYEQQRRRGIPMV
jgi:hypothetical protein